MADTDRQSVNSPDGRTWTVSIESRKRSFKETRETPFFWAHIIFTGIIAGVMIYIFRHNTGILWILVVATVIIWLVGVFGSAFGANIQADTPGPPKEHRLWKVTKRTSRKKAAQEIVEAIGHGNLTAEPPHTRLEEI